MKVTDIFKVIIIAFLVITFTVSMTSCKEAPVVEEQVVEQQEEASEDLTNIVNETKEETKETPVVVEEEVVEEIVKSLEIPGATLNPETGEYKAKAENDWGIPEGEIIGYHVVKGLKVETADGVEVEEDVIGLIPPVIEAMQKKIYEETGELKWAFPINLKETKGVKITETIFYENNMFEDYNPSNELDKQWKKTCLENLKLQIGESIDLGINIPKETPIYSPLSGGLFEGGLFYYPEEDNIALILEGTEQKSNYSFAMGFKNLEVTVVNAQGGEVKLGTPLAKTISDDYIKNMALERYFSKPGNYNCRLSGTIFLLDGHYESVSKLKDIMEINKIKVFIFNPANEDSK